LFKPFKKIVVYHIKSFVSLLKH